MGYRILIMLLLVSACTPLVPATTPAQLAYTPGPAVTLDDDVFDGGVFQVNYPDGWRVIRINVPQSPLEVVFASPDDTMLIRLALAPLPEVETEPGTTTRNDTVTVGDVTVYITGQAPVSQSQRFREIYQNVVESLRVEPQ